MISRHHLPRSRPWAAWALALLSLPMIWLVFVADGWTVNRLVVRLWSIPRGWGWPVTPDVVDAALNVALFVPAAFLTALWLPRVKWWVWGTIGLVVSLAIEGVQLVFLPRDASLWDVLFNTLGAFLGAGAGRAVSKWIGSRRSP